MVSPANVWIGPLCRATPSPVGPARRAAAGPLRALTRNSALLHGGQLYATPHAARSDGLMEPGYAQVSDDPHEPKAQASLGAPQIIALIAMVCGVARAASVLLHFREPAFEVLREILDLHLRELREKARLGIAQRRGKLGVHRLLDQAFGWGGVWTDVE